MIFRIRQTGTHSSLHSLWSARHPITSITSLNVRFINGHGFPRVFPQPRDLPHQQPALELMVLKSCPHRQKLTLQAPNLSLFAQNVRLELSYFFGFLSECLTRCLKSALIVLLTLALLLPLALLHIILTLALLLNLPNLTIRGRHLGRHRTDHCTGLPSGQSAASSSNGLAHRTQAPLTMKMRLRSQWL